MDKQTKEAVLKAQKELKRINSPKYEKAMAERKARIDNCIAHTRECAYAAIAHLLDILIVDDSYQIDQSIKAMLVEIAKMQGAITVLADEQYS